MGKAGKHLAGGLLAILATLPAGCDSQDSDRLEDVGRKVVEKLDTMTGGQRSRLATDLETLRGTWEEVALDARVTARLRWDKGLANARIAVHAADGVVELTGTIADPAQRQRALELAESTVGAEHVTESLTMAPATP